jgi:hypothetical protein
MYEANQSDQVQKAHFDSKNQAHLCVSNILDQD